MQAPSRTSDEAHLPPVNVDVTPELERRIHAADRSWTGPRLITLLLVTLALAVAALYGLASL